MVLQVGDKVIVWGAGTDKAFAKKIEHTNVGDKVDVITLSDGTKLSLPRINLDLSDFVWAYPKWNSIMDITNGQFEWGILPLGAAVFKLTGVPNCNQLEDTKREWVAADVVGKWLIIVKGQECVIFIVTGYTYPNYYVSRYNPDFGFSSWEISLNSEDFAPVLTDSLADFSSGNGDPASCTYQPRGLVSGPNVSLTGIKEVRFSFRYRSRVRCSYYGDRSYINPEYAVNSLYSSLFVHYSGSEEYGSDLVYEDGAGNILPSGGRMDRYIRNPDYPDYTQLVLSCEGMSGIQIPQITIPSSPTVLYNNFLFEVTPPIYVSSACQTTGVVTGDRYTIYDPVTKRLVFNDATKTLLSAQYWQDVALVGETIALTPIEYAWDGTGYVYLSGSKSIFSTIMFDDELRIDAQAGDTVQTIAYHQGERVAYGGETVSRELTDITSILRAGNNTITVTVRDTGGAKIGFITPIYVKRNMTVVTL